MKRFCSPPRAVACRPLLVLAVFALLLLVDALDAYACPGCKQALATADGEQSKMVDGYFWSILFMLSMPFTLFGLFAGSMYLAVRKARAQQVSSGEWGKVEGGTLKESSCKA